MNFKKIEFKLIASALLLLTSSNLQAEVRTWSYALEFRYNEKRDSVTWEGELNSRLMTLPLEIEGLGTLCARIKTKTVDQKNIILQIEWGSQARTRRENGPDSPSDTRCIIRAESKQSCALKQAKGDRTGHCHMVLHNVLLSAVNPQHLGPGWSLNSPLTPLHISRIEGDFTVLP